MTKINKALDYNKLLEQQAKGKLLKKILKFPLIAMVKYDGNYTVTEIRNGRTTHHTSGGLTYTHTDDGADCFKHAIDGYYMAERIGNKGKLGNRVLCNLRGSKTNQTSTNHTYKVFDYMTIDEYEKGRSNLPYAIRWTSLLSSDVARDSVVEFKTIRTKVELDEYLKEIVQLGYEGLMLIDPDWKWENTKSRKIGFCKLKSRPTADLLCIGITEGEGKYEGMVGALLLQDSSQRTVNVGSGLSDYDRSLGDTHIGRVYEIEYEQIIDTYIQPTIVCCREDKTEQDID